jgi:hypothetical protein
MAKITVRLPSKVPYGYVEFEVNDGEDWPDPEALAKDYVWHFSEYRKAEEAALTASNSAPPKSKPPIVRSIAEVMSDEDVDTEKQAADLIKRELGATEVDGEDDAPWNNKPEAEEKPYVTPASEDAWDFA